MSHVLYILLAFALGSLPFSYWLGRLFLKKDIRAVGDGNPGASNVFRSGSSWLGWLTLVLDYGKGFIPVFLLFDSVLAWSQPAGVLLAVAPVLGHAFSPFLLGRGGKAVTVTFGIWSGLTLGFVPIVLGGAYVLGTVLLRLYPDGWTVVLGFGAILLALWLGDQPSIFYAVWLANAGIVSWKHREDLRQRPYLRRKGAV